MVTRKRYNGSCWLYLQLIPKVRLVKKSFAKVREVTWTFIIMQNRSFLDQFGLQLIFGSTFTIWEPPKWLSPKLFFCWKRQILDQDLYQKYAFH